MTSDRLQLTADQRSCVVLAARLGIERKGRRWGPCPACRESQSSRSDPRPPLLIDPIGWACLRGECGARGSWGALVSLAVLDRPYSPDLASEVAAWIRDDANGAKITGYTASDPPSLPPVALEELRAMTAAMVAPSARCIGYLQGRGIWSDDHPPPVLSMAHAPVGLPEVETASGRRCSVWPWRADVVVGLRDLAGQLRSIHARRTWGPPDARPKALYPIGRERKGLVMMSPGARDGGPCLVVEGLTDYLLACTITPRVIGIGSGSPYVPQAVAAITHPDAPGRRYAAPYPPSPSLDLVDAGRDRAREVIRSLGLPVWG